VVITVARFNWPKYAGVAGLAVVAAVVGSPLLWLVTAVGLMWSVTSLVATWWVYDHRGVYGHVATDLPADRWASVHAGFDEATPTLARAIGHEPTQVLDLGVAGRASLRRARHRASDDTATVAALPLGTGSLDALFLTFAVHEVRATVDQRTLFAELARALRPGGRLVVTEHLRDPANLAVYGPGALHFQRAGTWRHRAAEAGLRLESEAPITPFVRRMVWTR
jgi:SAM-dependent methyltransferase